MDIVAGSEASLHDPTFSRINLVHGFSAPGWEAGNLDLSKRLEETTGLMPPSPEETHRLVSLGRRGQTEDVEDDETAWERAVMTEVFVEA
jgi:hypothetical protein